MKDELIKIEAHETLIQAVNARDLYEYLGLADSQWARWAKLNIENNDFAFENNDWVGFDMMSNGNKTRGYALSVDFAKRLAMMTKSEKGERVRVYFLGCERRANRQMTPAEALHQATALLVEVERRQLAIEAEQKQLALSNQAVVKRLDQIETAGDHFTILGYFRHVRGMSLPLAEAAEKGKVASKYCRDNEVPTGEVPDPRFGRVKTYPLWALDRLFRVDEVAH